MEGLVPANKGKRFAAGLIDLVVIPIVLGIVIGLDSAQTFYALIFTL